MKETRPAEQRKGRLFGNKYQSATLEGAQPTLFAAKGLDRTQGIYRGAAMTNH